jgi:uncharacterized membrane protein YcaP (DUF421 family)
MIDTLENIGDVWLGLNLDAKDFNFHQLLLRGLIIFFSLLLMIRLAGRRFLTNRNPLDVLLTFILASMLARGINGNTPFFCTIGTGFFLAGLYRGTAYLACRFHFVGRWLKGEPEPVIENGQVHKKTLERHHVSRHDLMEDLSSMEMWPTSPM